MKKYRVVDEKKFEKFLAVVDMVKLFAVLTTLLAVGQILTGVCYR